MVGRDMRWISTVTNLTTQGSEGTRVGWKDVQSDGNVQLPVGTLVRALAAFLDVGSWMLDVGLNC